MVSEQTFWQFSLEYYPQRKLPLLECQDKYGLNVNLLLWCLYLDSLKLGLNNDYFCFIRSEIHDSELELKQLRQARKQAKYKAPEAYKQFLEAELQLEKKQQQLIVQHFSRFQAHSAEQSNLELYLQTQAVCLPGEIMRMLTIAR